MTDYLYEYKKALRNGDEEEANKYYRKYRGEESEEKKETVEEDQGEGQEEEAEEESVEEKVSDPADMTVGEVKEYVGDNEELAEEILELELEGKNRTTLVSYLEDKA